MSSYFDLQLFLSVFVTLLVIMNPPGAVPIFLGLTASLTHAQRLVAAPRLAGGPGGDRGIRRVRPADPDLSAHQSGRAAGRRRPLLLLVALQLLVGQESGVNSDAGVNVALVPLGTPILAGPGAIVATMLAVRAANGVGGFLAVAVGLVAALLIVWLFLRFAGQVHKLLRDSGTMLVTRIAGLLLSAIAVQMIANSVRAFVATGS